jgi:hypothetical protein
MLLVVQRFKLTWVYVRVVLLVQLDGRNALRVATDQGFFPIVKELLLAGAIVDWTDKVRPSA